MAADLTHAAEVPAHKDPNKPADDFIALNKALRACFVCRLVKSERQFMDTGCENCPFLQLEEDRSRVTEYTTSNFAGMISVMDPTTSWAAKWLHLAKSVPGCYAMVINDDVPGNLRDVLEDRGIKLPHNVG